MELAELAAHIAAKVVRVSGGSLSFYQYDARMAPVMYWTPINWIAGWGLPQRQRKANMDKLAAFEACRIGLLEQIDGAYVAAVPDVDPSIRLDMRGSLGSAAARVWSPTEVRNLTAPPQP